MARCVYIAIFGSSTKQLPFPEVWSPAGPDWATPVGPFWRIQSASSFWPFFHPHIPFSKLQSLKYRTTNKTGIKRKAIKRAVSSLHRQDRLNYLTVYYITQRHQWIQNCRQNEYDVFNLTMPLQNDLTFSKPFLRTSMTIMFQRSAWLGPPQRQPTCGTGTVRHREIKLNCESETRNDDRLFLDTSEVSYMIFSLF